METAGGLRQRRSASSATPKNLQDDVQLLRDDSQRRTAAEVAAAAVPVETTATAASTSSSTSSTTTTTNNISSPKPVALLQDAIVIDAMFPKASILAVSVYLLLLAAVYGLVPSQYEREYLQGAERDCALLAAGMIALTTYLIVLPLGFVHGGMGSRQGRSFPALSGVLIAALTTMAMSICTNLLLALAPTIVVVDPITHARVFLVRWCEWIPLAGLMTFLSDTVDMEKGRKGFRLSMTVSLMQSLSCLCGILFPFCGGIVSWSITMLVAMVTYSAMFPRLWLRRKTYQQYVANQSSPSTTTTFSSTSTAESLVDMEEQDRRRFAYHLILACTSVWTVLVVLYFLNMMAHTLLPVGHALRFESLAMMVDTSFDVLAKAIYMKLIVDVHKHVFGAEGRALRQLDELRICMSVFWEHSLDVRRLDTFTDRVVLLPNPSHTTQLALGSPFFWYRFLSFPCVKTMGFERLYFRKHLCR
jgi:hypothetical protein